MSDRISALYFELQRRELTCPGCGWHGTGAELSVSEVFDSGIIEYVCPRCSYDIAFCAAPRSRKPRRTGTS